MLKRQKNGIQRKKIRFNKCYFESSITEIEKSKNEIEKYNTMSNKKYSVIYKINTNII